MIQRLKKKEKLIYFCKNFKPDMEEQSLAVSTHPDAENESR